MNYSESPDRPGCILRPSDTTSQRFRPDGYFLLLVSGTVTGGITVWGIPTAILNDDTITDKSSYWTQLENGFELTNDIKTAGFQCPPGITCELRAENGDAGRYAIWGYGHRSTWDASRGGL